jgi:hypothetical protein
LLSEQRKNRQFAIIKQAVRYVSYWIFRFFIVTWLPPNYFITRLPAVIFPINALSISKEEAENPVSLTSLMIEKINGLPNQEQKKSKFLLPGRNGR